MSVRVAIASSVLHIPHKITCGLRLRHLSVMMRIVTLIAVFLTLVIALCLEMAANTKPSSKVIEPPPELLPGKQQFPQAANCEALHDGRFSCDVDVNGTDIALTYNAITYRILYTFTSRPDQTLGDLMLAWGTPSGFARSGDATLVFWNTRAAYLTPRSFRPESLVKYVRYGDAEVPPLPWRGFVSQDYAPSPSPQN